jgi:DNA-binding NarL/FixJ family response regulator
MSSRESSRRNGARRAVLLVPRHGERRRVEELVRRSGIECLASASSAAGALALARELEPDVLIAAVAGHADTDEVCRLDGRVDGNLPVVVIGIGASRPALETALVLRTVAVQLAQQARKPNGNGARRVAVRQDDALTRRELDVLALAAEGNSNREIGRALWVTEETVKSHLASVYRKLGARGRSEAADVARSRGLLAQAKPAATQRP